MVATLGAEDGVLIAVPLVTVRALMTFLWAGFMIVPVVVGRGRRG
jgi:hypothetical protein